MNILQFLEFCIGEICTWPTNIIKLLFIEDPSSEEVIKEVTVFFYGHGVPLCYASYFYLISNEKAGLDELITMVTFYSRWFNVKDSLHNAKYYDTRHAKLCGSAGRTVYNWNQSYQKSPTYN
jgi:hypothetical protein